MARAIFTYVVPDSMDPAVRKIGIVKLTHKEQRDATERAINSEVLQAGGTDALFMELAKASVVKVNGAAVSVADETLDRAWESMDLVLRKMVKDEWQKLNLPSLDDQAAFIKSQAVEQETPREPPSADPVVAAMQPRARTILSYVVPKTMDANVRQVGLVKLTHGEQKAATDKAVAVGGGGAALFMELAKASVVKVNGTGVDGAALDTAWEAMDPKLRNMIMTEWQRLGETSKKDRKDFLESQTIEFE